MTYFAHEPLNVMISSRCLDDVPGERPARTLSDLRREIKARLESLRVAGKALFQVWIHEDEAIDSAGEVAWDICLRRAREADLVIVLYNGNAGWPGQAGQDGESIGICHEEFRVAYNQSPDKVRLIQLPVNPGLKGIQHERFQGWVTRLGLIGHQAASGTEALAATESAAVAGMLSLAHAGVGANARGAYYAGEALAWSRLDFASRRALTTRVVVEKLRARGSGNLPEGVAPNLALVPVGRREVVFVCDCIPASFGTAAARELVGQPFLRDHQTVAALPAIAAGPVHVIACQKSVTENQALRQLGFPDAQVVAAPFGVFVADPVQKIQMAFLAHCRDEDGTRAQVQRFLGWLGEQGEDRLLVERAVSRRKIVEAIRREQTGPTGGSTK